METQTKYQAPPSPVQKHRSISGSRATKDSILSEKVARTLELRTDTTQMMNALAALSSITEHSSESRAMDAKSVRGAIERDALLQAKQFEMQLKILVEVASDMRRHVERVSSFAHDLATMSEGGNGSNNANPSHDSRIDEEAESRIALSLNEAFRDYTEAEERAHTVAKFLERFEISPNDTLLLESFSCEENLTNLAAIEEFLDALDRVHGVRCELSRAFQSNEPGFGTTSVIRMMEALGTKQEAAYEKLYRWLQSYLRLDNAPMKSQHHSVRVEEEEEDDRLDEALAHPCVKRALHTLKHAPSFHRHMMEMISTLRRSEVTRRFLLALTSGHDGLPPIERMAHDPQNYVGDMLAFVYRAFSMERELVHGLVATSQAKDGSESKRNDEIEYDNSYLLEDDIGVAKPMTAFQLLSHALSGVARPLKARITQVIASLARRNSEDGSDDAPVDEESTLRNSISTLYLICGLLLFYHSAIFEKFGSAGGENDSTIASASIVDILMECLEDAVSAYTASIKVYGATIDSFVGDQSMIASTLVDLISDTRKKSPGYAADIACAPHISESLSLNLLCETILKPTIASCHSLENTEMLKSTLIAACKSGLSPDAAQPWIDTILSKEKDIVKDLVTIETDRVLKESGIGELFGSFSHRHDFPGIPLSACPGMDPDSLKDGLKAFYSSLYAPPLPQFEGIKDQKVRHDARSQTVTGVVNAYREIYEAITSDGAGYKDLSFLGHNPDQVKMLLSL
mmetsp:Transcript_27832/g.43187  ORF Transcript_27832/g.43187 Transcript_27832/m.43187 type:complete len:744 (+) Transcript_27832:58-2289(+)